MDDIIADLIGDSIKTISSKKERLVRAEHDFDFFCTTYLSHYFSTDPAPYHTILFDIASTGRLTSDHITALKPLINTKYHELLIPTDAVAGIVDIEPRGFSKTTRWALAYVLWQIVFKKKRFACLFMATQDLANIAIQNIKYEIESNDAIYADFGDMRGDIWKSDCITFANDTAICGFGAGSAVRGVKYKEHRPDLIICDDVQKDINVRTFAQRQKLDSWFRRSVLPLGRDIFTIVINTILHTNDLPSRLLSRIQARELKNWIGLRFASITPSGESLWPSYWSKARLDDKKNEVGSATFSTEYNNEPLADEERIFKPEWFQFYKIADLANMRVYMGVDPSAGKHDEFAIVTLGFDPDGRIKEIDEWAECCSVDAAVHKLIEKFLIYKPILIGFEDIGFQSVYKKHIIDAAAKKNVYLPIQGMSTHGVGKERILSLSPFIENGLLMFKEGHHKTIDQLTMYPVSEYDDLQDALYYAYAVAQNHSGSAAAFRLTSAPSRFAQTLARFRGR